MSKQSLYWCSFRDPFENFIGVVIIMGTSPGAAASKAITNGIVESERATCSMLGDKYIPLLEGYMDRLLDEEETRIAAKKVGLVLRETKRA